MLPLALCFVAIVVIGITYWVLKSTIPKCNRKLPPGTMGWPVLGETLQFFAPYTTSDMPPFIKKRIKKYGPVFRTNLVGRPVIISIDSDFNHYIFQQEGKLIESSYPDTVLKIFGNTTMASMHGFMFKYLKNMVLSMFGSQNLKKMLPEVVKDTSKKLKRWSVQESVEMKEATATMIFDFTAKKLISYDSEKSSENLLEYFQAFIQGLISFPVNIPGTAYNKCLQGSKNAMKMLKKLLQERRASPREEETDFFDCLLKELQQEGTDLTEEIAFNLIFLLLFASHETMSSATTFALKLLIENPVVLKKLTEEHEEIIRCRENPDSGFTWNEYKSLTYTFQVINETVRLANIAPGIFRKSLKDINFKEYTIPAGWMIMVCPPAVHLNPDTYKDPLDFNPTRWEGMESHGASKNFMAFGGGMRFCVGSDFARMHMTVFLHNLVTKYKFKFIEGGDILRTPGLQFPNGLHMQISENDKEI